MHKYIIGDKVVVTSNFSGHGFYEYTEVEIVEQLIDRYSGNPYYGAMGLDNYGEYEVWYLTDDEIEKAPTT